MMLRRKHLFAVGVFCTALAGLIVADALVSPAAALCRFNARGVCTGDCDGKKCNNPDDTTCDCKGVRHSISPQLDTVSLSQQEGMRLSKAYQCVPAAMTPAPCGGVTITN